MLFWQLSLKEYIASIAVIAVITSIVIFLLLLTMSFIYFEYGGILIASTRSICKYKLFNNSINFSNLSLSRVFITSWGYGIVL
jgi:hypothetical protein